MTTDLRWADTTFRSFCDDILADRYYSFARYGDGEWSWITGRPRRNRCGHRPFPTASAELRDAILSRPAYRLGNMGVLRDWPARDDTHRAGWGWARDWIDEHGLADIEWHRNLIWANQLVLDSQAGRRFALLDTLRRCRVVVVGPDYLAGVPFPIARHIVVRRPDCWFDVNRAEAEIRDDAGQQSTVYALSCSLVANLLVHRLWPTVGQDNWLIDFGSIWEPFVGMAIRRYHQDIKVVT